MNLMKSRDSQHHVVAQWLADFEKWNFRIRAKAASPWHEDLDQVFGTMSDVDKDGPGLFGSVVLQSVCRQSHCSEQYLGV